MKIKFLGTAAAEGIPGIFCECDTCRRSRKLGGRNIRTRSQALVDNKILLDFPADTYMHFLMHNIPLSKITTCLITHSHTDHLYPDEIKVRRDGFAHIENKQPLVFYSGESGYNMLKKAKETYNLSHEVMPVQIEPYKSFTADGYDILPLTASHDDKASTVIYLIKKDNKSLLYSHDTSEYPEETWEALRGKKLDFISIDCTEGQSDASYRGHLTIDRVAKMRERMFKMGIADEHTVFVLNHFSHNGGNVVYDDFVKIAKKQNFLVSYDGMEYDF